MSISREAAITTEPNVFLGDSIVECVSCKFGRSLATMEQNIFLCEQFFFILIGSFLFRVCFLAS